VHGGPLLADFRRHLVDDVDVIRRPCRQPFDERRNRTADVNFHAIVDALAQQGEDLLQLRGSNSGHESSPDIAKAWLSEAFAQDGVDSTRHSAARQRAAKPAGAPTTTQGTNGVSNEQPRPEIRASILLQVLLDGGGQAPAVYVWLSPHQFPRVSGIRCCGHGMVDSIALRWLHSPHT